jgi:hypothetical protein
LLLHAQQMEKEADELKREAARLLIEDEARSISL